MEAPELFVEWMSNNVQKDAGNGLEYRYHPRSDRHSVALCELVLSDLLAASIELRNHANAAEVAFGINLAYHWLLTEKDKTIDLALGTPAEPVMLPQVPITRVDKLQDIRLSLEAKSCMTEHSKSKPRLFDELSSSYEIVHAGNNEAIAAGITVVNIAETFVSPLRNLHWSQGDELEVTRHKMPDKAADMVTHLRGLRVRDRVEQTGFDAYATIVISCDNLRPATLWTAPPAPQPGDPDHYHTLVERIARSYAERFA